MDVEGLGAVDAALFRPLTSVVTGATYAQGAYGRYAIPCIPELGAVAYLTTSPLVLTANGTPLPLVEIVFALDAGAARAILIFQGATTDPYALKLDERGYTAMRVAAPAVPTSTVALPSVDHSVAIVAPPFARTTFAESSKVPRPSKLRDSVARIEHQSGKLACATLPTTFFGLRVERGPGLTLLAFTDAERALFAPFATVAGALAVKEVAGAPPYYTDNSTTFYPLRGLKTQLVILGTWYDLTELVYVADDDWACVLVFQTQGNLAAIKLGRADFTMIAVGDARISTVLGKRPGTPVPVWKELHVPTQAEAVNTPPDEGSLLLPHVSRYAAGQVYTQLTCVALSTCLSSLGTSDLAACASSVCPKPAGAPKTCTRFTRVPRSTARRTRCSPCLCRAR
jgi:hypothetical protein